MAERLGDRVRKARERYGMPASVLAKRAGITRQQVYMIETNRTPDPGVYTVKALADVLGVSVGYLIEGAEQETEQFAAALV